MLSKEANLNGVGPIIKVLAEPHVLHACRRAWRMSNVPREITSRTLVFWPLPSKKIKQDKFSISMVDSSNLWGTSQSSAIH